EHNGKGVDLTYKEVSNSPISYYSVVNNERNVSSLNLFRVGAIYGEEEEQEIDFSVDWPRSRRLTNLPEGILDFFDGLKSFEKFVVEFLAKREGNSASFAVMKLLESDIREQQLSKSETHESSS
ncbi:unnamed protein product, partial [Dovyalis caffra]